MASTVWRGFISFGLISIPVRIFRAARPERVGLRRLYRKTAAPEPVALPLDKTEEPEPVRLPSSRSGALPKSSELNLFSAPPPAPQPVLMPVRQASVQRDNGRAVPDAEIVKGYEFEKGRYVELEPDELTSILPKTSGGMEIQEFVALAEVDPVYFETSYYVRPEEAGERAYALLYRAMQTTGLVAVAQFAMHGREHVVIVRPGKSGLLAHTMYFENEVRADEEFRADSAAVAEKELKLAETLIQTLTSAFEPGKYRDTYRERLESIIARKVEGLPAPAPEAPLRSAPVVDIAEALRKSLANLKKPAASEATAPDTSKKPATGPIKARKAAKTATR